MGEYELEDVIEFSLCCEGLLLLGGGYFLWSLCKEERCGFQRLVSLDDKRLL
jgi:hypothetical protein